MSPRTRRTERPYVNGLTWRTLTRLLTWLVLAIPLTIGVIVLTPAPAAAQPQAEEPEVDAPVVKAEVELDLDFADVPTPPAPPAAPAPDGPPWPLATFTGEEVMNFEGSASDLFAIGKLSTVGGDVSGNAFVAGQTVQFDDGVVVGDVFTAGEMVSIESELRSDLYLAGGSCRLEPGATVRGNLYVGCGSVVIEAPVGGSIVGGGGDVTLNAPVGGDVEIEVGALKIGADADIAGDLTYTAPEEAETNAGVVHGETEWIEGTTHHEGPKPHEHQGGPGFFGFWFLHAWGFVSALIMGFVLLAMLGPLARRASDALAAQPGKSLGIGFVALVVVPVAAVVLIAMLLTWPLGVFGLMLYLLATYVAALIPALALGQLIMERTFGKDEPSPYASLALGLVILHLLFAIPFFGFLLQVVAISAGLGAIYLLHNGNGHAAGADPAAA